MTKWTEGKGQKTVLCVSETVLFTDRADARAAR